MDDPLTLHLNYGIYQHPEKDQSIIILVTQPLKSSSCNPKVWIIVPIAPSITIIRLCSSAAKTAAKPATNKMVSNFMHNPYIRVEFHKTQWLFFGRHAYGEWLLCGGDKRLLK